MDTVTVVSGDSPAWALVIVTIFGVIAAGYAGYYAKRIFDIETDRDAARIEQEDRAQAVLVSAWAVITMDTSMGMPKYGLGAHATNGSGQPIYDVKIKWLVSGKTILLEDTGLVPPGSPYAWNLPDGKFSEIPVQESHRIRTKEWCLSVVKNSRILISFTDAENRNWTRQDDGHLEQIWLESSKSGNFFKRFMRARRKGRS